MKAKTMGGDSFSKSQKPCPILIQCDLMMTHVVSINTSRIPHGKAKPKVRPADFEKMGWHRKMFIKVPKVCWKGVREVWSGPRIPVGRKGSEKKGDGYQNTKEDVCGGYWPIINWPMVMGWV